MPKNIIKPLFNMKTKNLSLSSSTTLFQNLKASYRGLQYKLFLLKLMRSSLNVQPPYSPTAVEIQTINRCNTDCIVCPYKKTVATQKLETMSGDLYKKLLNELKKEKKFELLIFGAQSEPLLDKNLIAKCKLFKQILPNKKIEIVTNAQLLSPSYSDEVFKYVDSFQISINAFHKKTYEKTMPNLDYNILMENLNYIKNNKNYREKIILRFIAQKSNVNEKSVFRKYWRSQGMATLVFNANSRLGTVDNKLPVNKKRNLNIKKLKLNKLILSHCTIPFFTAYIRANGDFIYCFNDWTENNIVGNINDSELSKIYNSDKFNNFRKQILANNVNDIICKDCDLINDNIWLE